MTMTGKLKHILWIGFIMISAVSCGGDHFKGPPLSPLPIQMTGQAEGPVVMGYSVVKRPEQHAAAPYCLRMEQTGRVVAEGSAQEMVDRRIAVLQELYGSGNFNVTFPTLGGKQVWIDRFILEDWRIQENIYTGHHRLLDPSDLRKAWGSWGACRTEMEKIRIEQDIRPSSDHLVVILHGLFRAKDSFKKMRTRFIDEGYAVADMNYPSSRLSVRDHANNLHQLLDNMWGYKTVSFVTHSLGGMVIRVALNDPAAWKNRMDTHRLVMIAPPSQGAALADQLQSVDLFHKIAGPVGASLTTEGASAIPLPNVPFIVVAGAASCDGSMNPLIPGKDDGVVGVDEAQLPGARQFMVVDASHTFIMEKANVIDATVEFLAAE